MKSRLILNSAIAFAVAAHCLLPNSLGADGWKARTIEPVTNPLFFEDPQINSEIRPLFLYHRIDDDFVTQGGNVKVYALQARWAVTKRLAIIATKDGYIEFNPKSGLKRTDGWADIGAGLKYAIVDDPARNFILTPGFKFEFPTGNERVFQGNGKGEWDVFLSTAKGWGNFHVTGSGGVRLPNDWDDETASAHYSVQLDYYVGQYFIPFIAGNGFTVLSEANATPFDFEGYDLINFGAADAKGRTQVTIGVGARSRILENLDVGFAYETGVTRPRNLFDQRYTVDVIYRF
jgi:hypothetical protein